MNICLLCYRGNPYCGGQGIYLYYLSRELAALGHSVTILVGSPQPSPIEWARVIPVENMNLWGVRRNFLTPSAPWSIFRPLNFFEYAATRFGFLPEMLIFSLRAFRLLQRTLRRQDFDIIHDVQSLGYGLLLAKFFRRPIVTTVHHPLTIDYQASLQRDRNFTERYYTVVFYPLGMQRRVIRHCDRIITSSRATAREIEQAFGLSPERIRMVYNGIDADFFQPADGVRREPTHLLFVGNTDDTKKGILYLLQALALLPQEVKLTIVDQGLPYKTYAPQVAADCGVSGRVTFTGKVSAERLRELYQRAGVVVLPSLYEGFGLPAAEAMACGAPVVASHVGALPEVVGKNGAGILLPPRDPAALAAAVLTAIQDEPGRKTMGRIGRQRVLELFTWRKVAERTVEVYEEVIRSEK